MKKQKNNFIKKIKTIIDNKLSKSSVNTRKKTGFTLAETIIVLGIIGVVAAMTISILTKKIQHKIFEDKFKKSVSIINQVIQKTRFELGVENLHSYCKLNSTSCYEALAYQAGVIDKQNMMNSAHGIRYTIKRNYSDISTFNGKNILVSDSIVHPLILTNPLPDGSYLGWLYTGGNLRFGLDLNGNARPNRLGHDVFLFLLSADGKDKLTANTPNNNITDEDAEAHYKDYTGASKDFYLNTYGYPCNLTSTRKGNGLYCAYYALKNECPWDSTKTYWECLP